MQRRTTESVLWKAAWVVFAVAATSWLTARAEAADEGVPVAGSLGEAARQQAEVEMPVAEVPQDETPELQAFTDDAEVNEPDYAEVAADARAIVAEIEERLIETHMADAVRELSAGDGVGGYPYAEEAYVDMKEMIKFAEEASGKACDNCKFKLEIKMGMPMGNTLSQLAKGMNPGADGLGGFGQGSQGQSGQGGSSPQFGMYGPDPFGEKTRQSRALGNKKAKDVDSLKGPPDPIAGDVEELSSSKDEDLQFSVEGDEGVMEAYRPLIEEYFKRMAEED